LFLKFLSIFIKTTMLLIFKDEITIDLQSL
jgi:hypothetical protein